MGQDGCNQRDTGIRFLLFEADRTADFIGRELPGGASQHL
jgi:hypothetical protein